MELAVNRKTLKIEFKIDAKNNHHDLIWLKQVLGFNEDNQTLKIDEQGEGWNLAKFNKKYRIMKVY